MLFLWTEELSTGVRELDEQQRDLLQRIKALFDACGKGIGRAEFPRFHGFLQDYVTTRLHAEEQCMSGRGYAGMLMHRQEHDLFKVEVAELGNKMRSAGARPEVIIYGLRISVEWVASHVRKSDRDLAEFLRARAFTANSFATRTEVWRANCRRNNETTVKGATACVPQTNSSSRL